MNKKYLYLIEDNGTFKIGYTTNILKRRQSYITHNSDIDITSYMEVSDKSLEGTVQMELVKKRYKRINKSEWFEGTFSPLLFKEIVTYYNNRFLNGYK